VDKAAIKARLVPVMIDLGTPATARLQSQIGEALSTIATLDFPEQWEGLVDVSVQIPSRALGHNWSDLEQELVRSLSPDNFVVNNGVLATAHSIFRRCAMLGSNGEKPC
jgi:exportin-2 (importin alpha re-exporter)